MKFGLLYMILFSNGLVIGYWLLVIKIPAWLSRTSNKRGDKDE